MNSESKLIREIVQTIEGENPEISHIMRNTDITDDQILTQLKEHILGLLREHPQAYAYYSGEESGEKAFFKLSWRDFAFIRFLDYLEHEGSAFEDPNLHGLQVVSRPFSLLRKAIAQQEYPGSQDFYMDMLHLLRQLNGIERPQLPTRQQVQEWMEQHPSGLDNEIITLRNINKNRIISLLIEKIESSPTSKYQFLPTDQTEQKRQKLTAWWEEDLFHLKYAIRSAEELNRFLDYTIPEAEMNIMHQAEAKGIPIFVTPYFLSLLHVHTPETLHNTDLAIRNYVLYSKELVEEFGNISAWEMEDIVEPGKPNAAGWLLPAHTIHRRYPNVAIFIPSTMGRACGGLCSYCQRMYDFQNGNFNFELDTLKPEESWHDTLPRLMEYFRYDSQLQDILITGGDAMMSSVASLAEILEAVYAMALAKQQDNETRPDGGKYAEIVRVRLGTKIPIYLPQRITGERVEVLRAFREKAEQIGIKQFVIQTHFSSSMEITPEAAGAVAKLLDAGWAVTNQEVFTVAASRRGHTAKLRKELCAIGVLPYYTFTVKGYHENSRLFANNSRSIQEQVEEKSIGRVDPKYYSRIRSFMKTPQLMVEQLQSIMEAEEIQFLSTDRNTINLPGVGKSNTYRTIGITDDGRRVLSFEQDHSRPHSPIIETMKNIIIIESKSVSEYLRQIEESGDAASDYESIWGYSAGYIEARIPIYEYPGYTFTTTSDFTNLMLPGVKEL